MVADRESAKRGSEDANEEGEEKTKRSPRNKGARPEDMIREVKAGGGGCSSLRVLGGEWVTMNSHGVEILVAGGVEEMVRATPSGLFIFFLFLFLYHAFIVFRYKKLRAALAMEKTKPINQKPNIKNQITRSSAILKSRQNNRLSLTNK